MLLGPRKIEAIDRFLGPGNGVSKERAGAVEGDDKGVGFVVVGGGKGKCEVRVGQVGELLLLELSFVLPVHCYNQKEMKCGQSTILDYSFHKIIISVYFG